MRFTFPFWDSRYPPFRRGVLSVRKTEVGLHVVIVWRHKKRRSPYAPPHKSWAWLLPVGRALRRA